MSTYHTGPVAATEVPVSVGGIARAVGASLIASEAGAAGVTNLELRDCRGSDGNGGHKSAEDSGDLHFERWVVVLVECGIGVCVN